MRLHSSLILLLIAVVPVRAAGGQQPPANLAQAERDFADALVNHDRAAFEALFAADAECTLPSVTRGPKAIADAWLPFFIDPGTTMLLTTGSLATAAEGTIGTSSGTFAIRGRTSNGIQTVPAGTYAVTWRLLDGRWKIVALGGSGQRAAAGGRDRGGVGRFRFGMTRDQVSGISDCEPYTHVAVTGGLECAHYRFDDREMNISFLFTGDRLGRIQLWYYEGESSVEAEEAIGRVLTFLQRTTGGVTIPARTEVPLTAEGIISALNRAAPPRGRQIVQLEISGAREGSTAWFARVGRHEHGYLVMLFAGEAGG